MSFDMNNIPTVGIMSQIMHMSMQQAQLLFDQYDLKMGQAGILFIMAHFGEMSQRELASKMHVTPPSITAAIQKMEKMEFIIRQPDGKDQRVMRLSLTEKGRACLAHAKGVAKQMDELMFKGMSQEEKLLLRRLLLQMRENLEKEKEISSIRKKQTEF